jgi:hypothetical protein
MFFFLSFFFYKIGEQEGRTGPAQGSGEELVGTSERREVVRKGSRRVNTVQKMCTHECKCKNYTILFQESGEVG